MLCYVYNWWTLWRMFSIFYGLWNNLNKQRGQYETCKQVNLVPVLTICCWCYAGFYINIKGITLSFFQTLPYPIPTPACHPSHSSSIPLNLDSALRPFKDSNLQTTLQAQGRYWKASFIMILTSIKVFALILQFISLGGMCCLHNFILFDLFILFYHSDLK